MTSLVPIPWQPSLFTAPSTLTYLEAACRRLGRNIIIREPDGAWRPYAVQKKYYLAWVAYKRYLAGQGPWAPKAPVAADPDSGQRGHPRGASLDVRDPTAAVRSAMFAVGFFGDPTEDWHFNNPNLYNMPIIMTNYQTAGSGQWTPLDPVDPPTLNTTRKIPNMAAFVVLKESTAGLPKGQMQFALYDSGAVKPSARFREFTEYPVAEQLVNALHGYPQNGDPKVAEHGSAVILPDYAYEAWKNDV